MNNSNYYKNFYHFTELACFSYAILQIHAFTMKNYKIDYNSQEFFEVNIVTSGEGVFYTDGSEIPVKKGNVFIIPPFTLHKYERVRDFDVVHIIINNAFMERYSHDMQMFPSFQTLFPSLPKNAAKILHDLNFSLSDEEMDDITPHFQAICDLTQNNDVESLLITNAEAIIVLSKLCAIYDRRYMSKNDLSATKDKAFLKSMAYLQENYNRPVSIDDLAKMAQMSRTAYISAFKDITGTTPGKFQNELKTARGKELLEKTSLKVSTIAEMVGCYDTSHFCRLFTGKYGVSPLKCRNNS